MNISRRSVRERIPCLPILWIAASTLMLSSASGLEQLQPAAAEPLRPIRVARVASQSRRIASMEQQLRRQINQQRRRHGLRPLMSNSRLSAVARDYSRQMATHNFYRHRGLRGETHRQRVEAAGIRPALVGENLMKISAAYRNPVALSVSGWMRSAGHRKNILLPQMTETGVGIWQRGSMYFVTQLYIEPRR